MQVGYVVKSLKGHDAGRIYLVTAVLNADFVLLSEIECGLIVSCQISSNSAQT